MVWAPKARNAITNSLLDLRSSLPVTAGRQVVDGPRVFSPESVLMFISCCNSGISMNNIVILFLLTPIA